MICNTVASSGVPGAGARSSSFGRSLIALGFALTVMALTSAPAAAQNAPFGGLFPFFSNKKPAPQPRVIRIAPDGRVYQNGRARIGYGANGSRRIYSPFTPTGHGRSALQDPDSLPGRPVRPRASYGGGYRTMCVRTCDGYYWPMSHGVSSSTFRRDRNRCDAACGNAAELFVMSASSDNVSEMRSLGGTRYGKLENAFRYRKETIPQCQCKPEPWSRVARMRHARFEVVDGGHALDGAVKVRNAKLATQILVRVTPLQIVPGSVAFAEGSAGHVVAYAQATDPNAGDDAETVVAALDGPADAPGAGLANGTKIFADKARNVTGNARSAGGIASGRWADLETSHAVRVARQVDADTDDRVRAAEWRAYQQRVRQQQQSQQAYATGSEEVRIINGRRYVRRSTGPGQMGVAVPVTSAQFSSAPKKQWRRTWGAQVLR